MRVSPQVPLAVLLVLVSLTGCRRNASPTPAPAAPEPPASVAQAASATPARQPAPQPAKPPEASPDRLPTAPNDASLRHPVHKELTSAIHLYLTDYRKMPADFETLVKEKYLKAMPKPPPGKRFALDRNRMQVVILD